MLLVRILETIRLFSDWPTANIRHRPLASGVSRFAIGFRLRVEGNPLDSVADWKLPKRETSEPFDAGARKTIVAPIDSTSIRTKEQDHEPL
jgi:hypothetical protein